MSQKTERGSLLHHQGRGKQTCLSKQSEALCYTTRVQQSKRVSQNRARLSATLPGFGKANTSLKTERGSLLHCQDSAKQTRLSKQRKALCYTTRIMQRQVRLSKQREVLCYTTRVQQSKQSSQNRARISVTPPGSAKQAHLSKQSESL